VESSLPSLGATLGDPGSAVDDNGSVVAAASLLLPLLLQVFELASVAISSSLGAEFLLGKLMVTLIVGSSVTVPASVTLIRLLLLLLLPATTSAAAGTEDSSSLDLQPP